MPLAKIDERGRVQLPSRLRQKMKLKEGDEFVAEDLGEDTIVLKKINLRALLEDVIVKAKSQDLDKLEKEIEEESNQLARQKFRYLLDNTVFKAAVKRKWIESTRTDLSSPGPPPGSGHAGLQGLDEWTPGPRRPEQACRNFGKLVVLSRGTQL